MLHVELSDHTRSRSCPQMHSKHCIKWCFWPISDFFTWPIRGLVRWDDKWWPSDEQGESILVLDTGYNTLHAVSRQASLQYAACSAASCSYCHDPQPLPGVIANFSELFKSMNVELSGRWRAFRDCSFMDSWAHFRFGKPEFKSNHATSKESSFHFCSELSFTGDRCAEVYPPAAITGRIDTEVDTLDHKIPSLATPSSSGCNNIIILATPHNTVTA